MSKPQTKIPVFWNGVVNHECVHARLADHQGLLGFAVIREPQIPILVGAKLVQKTLIQMTAHHAAKINNTEPCLRIQHQRADEAIVASKRGWFEMLVHFEVPTSRDSAAFAA